MTILSRLLLSLSPFALRQQWPFAARRRRFPDALRRDVLGDEWPESQAGEGAPESIVLLSWNDLDRGRDSSGVRHKAAAGLAQDPEGDGAPHSDAGCRRGA